MRKGTVLVLSSLVCVGSLAEAADAPRLVAAGRGSRRTLAVELDRGDGSVVRHVLKRGAGAVRPHGSGWDPAGTAAFVTWTEDRALLTSYSRDGGATWSEPQAMGGELMLLDGPVAPGAPMPEVTPALRLPADGRVHLVQFKTVGLPEWREAVAGLGGELLAFFPKNAHIVRMPPAAKAAVAALEFVERVEPYHPAYRIEPALREWAAGGSDGVRRLRVMAFEWGPAGKQRILDDARAMGATLAHGAPSGHIL